jgi:hypothetical protein
MRRGAIGARRVVPAVAAALVIGIGTWAAAPLAAASPVGTPRSGNAAPAAIAGDWEGSFTCSQGLTGLDLRIKRSGSKGSLQATFSFYPVPGNPTVPVGIFTMRGTYHSASRISLSYRHWVLQPPGYVMVSLSGKLADGRFHGTVRSAGCKSFSLRKPKGHPARSSVVATWKGSYRGCAQGATGLRLAVKRKGRTGSRLTATFSFYALRSNPAVPSGSFAMSGFYFPGGVVLDQSHWIHQPPGYEMVNLVGRPPHARKLGGVIVGCSAFSLRRS